MAREYLTGKWLTDLLVRISKPLPKGRKLIVVYGKAGPTIRNQLALAGFIWNKIAQRWEKILGRNQKIPPFL